ncbi:MAG TPA: magnesium-translocating P-type ATPase [Candidatus Saccharimonadales bacterium]|nr:magnesium-translocating P-type ATPase [Candidatus Saccharimonadales bacterium]
MSIGPRLAAAAEPEVPPRAMSLAVAARTSAAAVLDALRTTDQGLGDGEAAARLDALGANVLREHRVTAFGVLVRQFRNPLLLLLLACAAVSGFTGDPTDAVIIAAIVVVSVLLSFFNEFRAESAVEALHQEIHHRALVRRNGRDQLIDTIALVPGDIVSLTVGNIVPADLRLLDVDSLECDEAVLTGESLPVAKTAAPQPDAAGVNLASCAFMGTIVHEGAGHGVVIATGPATAFGGIASGLAERASASAFQRGLSSFSTLLVRVAGVLTVTIFVFNVAFHKPLLDALLFSLAIAVGITPELMPAIVTVGLSSGSRALARKRVLVKRLVAIEDLGNIQILFTDKTGTLTDGAITFDRCIAPGGEPSEAPLLFGLVCNESVRGSDGPVGGNTLDQALWADRRSTDPQLLATQASVYTRIGRLPFDHERQLASVLVDGPDGRLLVTKGAPEVVLSRCAAPPPQAAVTLERLFHEGARVVAVATRAATSSHLAYDDERDLTLAGFLTFVDRPKPDAGAAIARLHTLGIEVKVITGDNGTVAATVCTQIGVDPGAVLTGKALDALDDAQLAAVIPATRVFARVSPDQKSRIIKVTRRTGVDVAFLGDGVNDAVALHHADVGISVDSATDVAKDAADIVLLDKDLGVLADGVVEGRRVFANTIKYVLMATSSNFGNMFSAAVASVFLSFLPMLPSQILLNNLLYNAGQLSIPTDAVDAETLARPAAWDIAFVRRFMLVFGPVSSLFDFLTFFVMLELLKAGHSEFRTGWFVESLATQTLVIYVIRTRRIPFVRSRPSLAMLIVPTSCAVAGAVVPFTPVATALGFSPLPPVFFVILVAMIATYLGLVECVKVFFYAAHPRAFAKPPTTHPDRLTRRIGRRLSHFTRHGASR